MHTYYTRRLLESSDAKLDQLIKNTAKEHLEDLEAVTGYAVGYGGTPGDFYTTSLIISKPFEKEYFLKMVHNDNPVVRAMSLICLAREDISQFENIIRHFYTDTSEVAYNPLGCGVFRKSLGTIAKGIIEDPNLLDCWSPAHTDWKISTSKRDSTYTQQQLNIINALIKEGADVNTKDQNGETPLHYAAQNGSTHIAKLLIANSAVVNAKNNNNETPLCCAILWGYKDVSELLIIKGSDLNTKTIKGHTPLTIAKEMNYQGLCELLREYGAKE